MKKSTTLIILLLLSTSIYAIFSFYWDDTYQHTVTSGYSNEGRKIATDANGNVFVLSDVTSDIDTANHPVATTQFMVVLRKYSPSGSLLNQKILNVNNMVLSGTYDYNSAFALEIDASGSVFIGFNKFNTAGNNYDVAVMKYDNTLSTSWTYYQSSTSNETGIAIVLRGSATFLLYKTVNGANTTYSIGRVLPNISTSQPLYSFDPNIDVVNSITTTPTLNLFVTGYRVISGVKNVMTASVNTSGLLKWKSTFNNNSISGDDFGSKLMVGADGFIYVTGTSYVNATNGNDAIVLRYNAANGTRNAQTFLNQTAGQSNNDNGIDIARAATGNIYVSTTHGNTDIYMYRLSTTNGVTVNASTSYKPTPLVYNSLTGISISDVKVASSNNVYVTGSVTATSPSGNFTASYLVKFGFTGSVFSALDFLETDGSNTDNFQGVGIALDAARNNLITLRSYWMSNFSHTIENVRVEDYSLSSLRISNNNISSGLENNVQHIYPNPANEFVHIREVKNHCNLYIYDLSGKLITHLQQNGNFIDLSGIEPGIYLFKGETDSESFVEKVVIK